MREASESMPAKCYDAIDTHAEPFNIQKKTFLMPIRLESPMVITLLLNRVSYEKAVNNADISFNGWMHGPASNDPDIDSALPLLGLRKEEWGGLLVYGRSGQIFAVDEQAFVILEHLKAGNLLEDLIGKTFGFSEVDISSFQAQLQRNSITL